MPDLTTSGRDVTVLGRAVLWFSKKPLVQKLITEWKLTQAVVNRFVAGDHLEDAIDAIRVLNARGIGGILDLLGEGVNDPDSAGAAADDYLQAIKRVEETGIDTTITVKLTQLGLSFDKGQCIDHLRRLAAEAAAIDRRIEIDMEESKFVLDTLDVYRVLQADYPDIRLAVQCYLRRTPVDLETFAAVRPRIRLVKGAYAEPDHLAFQKNSEIESQFRFLTDWLFEKGSDPAIATHDSSLIEHTQRAAFNAGVDQKSYEFQMLYGVRTKLQDQLAKQGYRVRIYVPYGDAWYPYLMRRIAERPANIRFVLRALVRG